MSDRRKELSRRVARELARAGVPVRTDVAVGGMVVDFLVETPDRRRIVIESRAWREARGVKARALHLAAGLKAAAGADLAVVVVDDVANARPSEGLVAVDELGTWLKGRLARAASNRAERRPEAAPAASKPLVFAAMPFARRYEDVFLVAMAHAARKAGAVCTRVDRTEFEGDIVAEIKRLIGKAKAVISDLSEAKPNVLFETGYAHALGKPTIHICSTPLAELPFDVRNWNTLAYEPGRTADLRDPLARRLRALLKTA